MSFRFWREDEAVDGSGRNVRDSARALVQALELTEHQQVLLGHTLGNILPILSALVDFVDGEELARKLGRQVEHLQEIDSAIRAEYAAETRRPKHYLGPDELARAAAGCCCDDDQIASGCGSPYHTPVGGSSASVG